MKSQTQITNILIFLIHLFLIHVIQGYKCPSPEKIKREISFDKVVIQEPFPYPYNGINVFNGVKSQQKGICNTTIPKYCTIPTDKCNCIPFSKYLLFNLISINKTKQLSPKDITIAVKEAKTITYVDSILTPIAYNVLCNYNVSKWSHTYSCLPKFCNNTQKACLNSTNTCTCIAQPCNLYVFI
tara:strand:- start:3215 stop:3766 length:552 start_codon:yes stop_codon:yes gene_type:complete